MDTEKDFSEIISSLMQNPQVTEIISSLKNGTSPSGSEQEKRPSDAPAADKHENAGAASEFSIPPEILASLPQMMQVLSGMGIGTSSAKGAVDNKLTPQKNGHRKALLTALRPYLSDKRCAVIDGLLQFEGLAGVLGTINNNIK